MPKSKKTHAKSKKDSAKAKNTKAKAKQIPSLSRSPAISRNIEVKIDKLTPEAVTVLKNSYEEMLTAHHYYERKKFEQAIPMFEKLSAEGNVLSLITLGSFYLEGANDIPKDIPKGLELLQKAGELGLGEAYVIIGNTYELGIDIDQDYAKAKEYYEKGDALESSKATCCLGNLYHYGLGVEQDLEKAYQLFQKAIDLGCADGYAHISLMYKEGTYLAQNIDESKNLLQQSVTQGSPVGKLYLGKMYIAGDLGFPKAPNEGAQSIMDAIREGAMVDEETRKKAEQILSFKKPSISRSIDVDISKLAPETLDTLQKGMQDMLTANQYYDSGDIEQAIPIFEKLSTEGNVLSMVTLGCIYLEGNNVIPKDTSKGLELLQKAGDLRLGDAYVVIGNTYEQGIDVNQDYAKAKGYYEKGDALESRKAACCLGNMYHLGLGCEQDLKKAYQLFQKAIDLDCADGYAYLSVMYKEGNYLKQNLKKSKDLLMQAVANGSPLGKLYLGKMYLTGDKGIPKNTKMGAQYIKEAINQGVIVDEDTRKKVEKY